MKLLAVSGGPDSMLLLSDYRKESIVVAHVNYHKRKDSDNDESIVREFCDANNIPLEILNIKDKPKGNFQDWARKKRYTFFKKIYDKHECMELLTAHHKDDFIETAIMQQESGRTPRYFGIKKNNEIDGMKIVRPFVHSYFKHEILKICKKEAIPYAVDSSNAEPIFERNKVRIELSKKTPKEKQDIYSWFKMSNKILVKKFKRVDKKYNQWEKSRFELPFIRNEERDKKEILFEFIHKNFNEIKLSKGKIDALIQFVDGLEGNKEFKLDAKNKILKKSGKLVI